MSTVIRTNLDDMAVQAGFKRMQDGATKTSVAIDRMAKQTMTGAKVSAEGLGFVSQALGRIHPSLALLGEQSTKQLPTIMALGTSMSKYVFAGGALAAIGVSAGKIAFEMGKVRHETVDANSALGQLIETSNTVKKDSFFGRLMSGALAASLRAFGTSQAEIEEQQRDMARGGSWRDKGEEGKNRSEGIGNSLRSAQDQRQKVKDYTSGIDGMDSASKIQRLLEAEKQRIAGLIQLGKLTNEEAQASDAYTQALTDQYDVVLGRINKLREVEKDLATEEKQRWITEIDDKKEAKKLLDDLIGEYHELYNTDQLTAQRKKELLAAITLAQGAYNQELGKEAQLRKDNKEFGKDLAQEKTNIARKQELESAISLRQVRSRMVEDTMRLERINGQGVDVDRQRKAIQQEILSLLQKEAELKQKNLEATVDDLKKHFAIFAAKDKDRAADVAAKGGGVGGGGPAQAAGQPQGWQRWGGPVGLGPQPFWQGGRNSIWGQNGGQGGGAGQPGPDVAGGGQNGEGGDFFGELMGAPANRRNRQKFIKDVKKLAKDKLKEQLDDIDEQFDAEIAAAGNDPAKIHKANKAKGAATRRAREDFRSGRTKEQAQGELLDDAANKMVDAVADNAGLGKDSTEALKRLANEAVAKQAEIQQLRAQVDTVNELLRTLAGKRAAANQQAGSRF